MFKSLVALALSMSAGAMILSAIEPGLKFPSSQPAVLLNASRANPAAQPAPIAQTWRQVLVICAADSRHKMMSGNGIDTRNDAHLTIDALGRLTVNPAWTRRLQLEGFDDTLIVCIEMTPNADSVSLAQIKALDLLIPHLRSELRLREHMIRYESLHPAINDLASHLAARARWHDALSLGG